MEKWETVLISSQSVGCWRWGMGADPGDLKILRMGLVENGDAIGLAGNPPEIQSLLESGSHGVE
jgi:hypothetical protein